MRHAHKMTVELDNFAAHRAQFSFYDKCDSAVCIIHQTVALCSHLDRNTRAAANITTYTHFEMEVILEKMSRIEMCNWRSEGKNNSLSEQFRQEGNAYFAEKTMDSYISALRLYNQAICNGVYHTEALGLAFSNRSAVYFEMKLYKECVENIEWALEQKRFPIHLHKKLIERHKIATAAIAEGEMAANVLGPIVPVLTLPAHPIVPFLASTLELRENEQYGRHIVTTEDLKVGDVIAIDIPFCNVVGDEMQYERCDNCCLEANRNLIPCHKCTRVMYCSVKCRDKAFRRFHRMECTGMKYIQIRFPSAQARLALRTIFCMLNHFESLEAVTQFTNNINVNETIFDMDYRAGPVETRERYVPVYTMQVAEPDPSIQEKMLELEGTLAMIITHCNPYQQAPDVENLGNLIMLLRHHYYAIDRNYCVVPDAGKSVELHRAGSGRFETDDCMGVYLFRNLINHACVPNVTTTKWGNRLVFTVIKPIKANEQITDCYE